MSFKVRQRKSAKASPPGKPLTEGCRSYGGHRPLSLANTSTGGEAIDTATPQSLAKTWPGSCLQEERASDTSLTVDACQEQCLHASDRTDLVVEMAEEDYGADSRPAKDNTDRGTALSQGSGSFRAKAKLFARKKGPQIARAGVTIGLFVFNVVSVCC